MLFAAPFISAPPTYEAVNLPITLAEMYRVAMNDRGTIVGTRLVGPNKYEGFVYSNGRLVSLAGDAPWVGGVNGRDEAVFNGGGKIVLWKNGCLTTLVQPKPGYLASASGFDNEGHILWNRVNEATWQCRIFFYPERKNNPFRDENYGAAFCNNMGQIVLASSGKPPDGRVHMFLWTKGKAVEVQVANPEATSRITGLNDQGIVVGVYSVRTIKSMDGDHAFKWQAGKCTELPVFTPNRFAFSSAKAINNLGQIVGTCNWLLNNGGDAGPGPQSVATLWMEDHIYDLNQLLASKERVNLYEAVAINNKGQILAMGQIPGQRAIQTFLLTPKP